MRGQVVNLCQDGGRVLLIRHGIYGEILYHVLIAALGVIAVVRRGTIQYRARDVCCLVGEGKGLLGRGEAGVVGGVAGYVCDFAGGDVVRVGKGGVVQVTLDLRSRLCGQWDEVCECASVVFRQGQGTMV